MYFTLIYFTRCTMHFTLCTMHRCTMHSILCTSIDVLTLVYLILCVLDPMYFSEGLHTEEPFAMLSGKKDF